MVDVLFVLSLIIPPVVLVIAFALLAVPVRREARAASQVRVHAHS